MDDKKFDEPLELLNRKLDKNLKEIEIQQIELENENLKKVTKKLLPEDRFSEWIHSICLVTFDIEIGQAIERIYPPNIKFTKREETNICYLSFPDSNSGCMGDTKFHFRTRLCRNRQFNHNIPTKTCKNLANYYPIDNNYLYGFVYFRQVKDKNAKRGYFQKSFVILTKYPFVNFFTNVISIIAPKYFDCGDDIFFKACKDFDKWPLIVDSELLTIKILNVNITTIIDCKNEKIISPTKEYTLTSIQNKFRDLDEKIINETDKLFKLANLTVPSVLSMNVYNCLLPVISHIQLIWELVITCEPLVVMASTPDICSEVVQSLVSLISPLRYSCDFRPFFTIHDSEFKEYTTKTHAPPPVILGVTNPFFAKTLQHWPHIIRIGDYTHSSQLKDAKILKSECIKTLDNKAGLYTKYKPFLQKDRTILKKLAKGTDTKRSNEIQNLIIFRYFQELTQSFLMPLERYIASLMPLQKNISPFKNVPIINPFNPDDFFKSLEIVSPQLTSGIKGDWSSLYKKFFRCANFANWYENRFKEISLKIKTLHIESICKANLIDFISDKDEVEVIDLILGIKRKIDLIETESLPIEPSSIQKLKDHLKDVINTLPQDIKPYFTEFNFLNSDNLKTVK